MVACLLCRRAASLLYLKRRAHKANIQGKELLAAELRCCCLLNLAAKHSKWRPSTKPQQPNNGRWSPTPWPPAHAAATAACCSPRNKLGNVCNSSPCLQPKEPTWECLQAHHSSSRAYERPQQLPSLPNTTPLGVLQLNLAQHCQPLI